MDITILVDWLGATWSAVPVWLVPVLLLQGLWTWWLIRKSNRGDLDRIPGPWKHGLPLLGNVLEVLRPDFHKVALKWANQYGPYCRLRILWRDVLIVSEPQAVAIICGRREGALDKAISMYHPVNQMCEPHENPNLLTSASDSKWRAIRKAVAVSFSWHNIKKKFPLVLQKADELVEWIRDKGPNVPIDVDCAALKVTLDVIGLVGFGHDYEAVKLDVVPHNHLLRVLPRCFTEVMLRIANPLRPYAPSLFKFGTKGATSFSSFQHEMQLLLDEVMAKGEPAADDQSIAAQLWRVQGTCGITLDRLLSETGILFVEGFETTGHTISWTLYNIANEAGVQSLIAAELDTMGLLSMPGRPARQLLLDDLHNLPYLTACVKESMRMYPVVSVGNGRMTTKYTQVGPYNIPPGVVVGTPLYVLHNTRHNWDQPDLFAPQRWTDIPVELYSCGAQNTVHTVLPSTRLQSQQPQQHHQLSTTTLAAACSVLSNATDDGCLLHSNMTAEDAIELVGDNRSVCTDEGPNLTTGPDVPEGTEGPDGTVNLLDQVDYASSARVAGMLQPAMLDGQPGVFQRRLCSRAVGARMAATTLRASHDIDNDQGKVGHPAATSLMGPAAASLTASAAASLTDPAAASLTDPAAADLTTAAASLTGLAAASLKAGCKDHGCDGSLHVHTTTSWAIQTEQYNDRLLSASSAGSTSGVDSVSEQHEGQECSSPGSSAGRVQLLEQHEVQECSSPGSSAGRVQLLEQHEVQECSSPGSSAGRIQSLEQHEVQECSSPGSSAGCIQLLEQHEIQECSSPGSSAGRVQLLEQHEIQECSSHGSSTELAPPFKQDVLHDRARPAAFPASIAIPGNVTVLAPSNTTLKSESRTSSNAAQALPQPCLLNRQQPIIPLTHARPSIAPRSQTEGGRFHQMNTSGGMEVVSGLGSGTGMLQISDSPSESQRTIFQAAIGDCAKLEQHGEAESCEEGEQLQRSCSPCPTVQIHTSGGTEVRVSGLGSNTGMPEILRSRPASRCLSFRQAAHLEQHLKAEPYEAGKQLYEEQDRTCLPCPADLKHRTERDAILEKSCDEAKQLQKTRGSCTTEAESVQSDGQNGALSNNDAEQPQKARRVSRVSTEVENQQSEGQNGASSAGSPVQQPSKPKGLAYMPFSEGPRNCVGQSLAKMEVMLVLVKLLGNFHIQLTPEMCEGRAAVKQRESTALTLQTKGTKGIQMYLTPRY